MVVKLVAEGLEPLNYFYDPWNIFDFIIVFLGILDYIITVGDVAIMRLLRLLRVFKLARSETSMHLCTYYSTEIF